MTPPFLQSDLKLNDKPLPCIQSFYMFYVSRRITGSKGSTDSSEKLLKQGRKSETNKQEGRELGENTQGREESKTSGPKLIININCMLYL